MKRKCWRVYQLKKSLKIITKQEWEEKKKKKKKNKKNAQNCVCEGLIMVVADFT